jgi:hypothetical protein
VFAQYRGAMHVPRCCSSWTRDRRGAGGGRRLATLCVLREGEVLDRPLDPQFPLGMFETSEYVAQRLQLRPADRLFVVSDGVVEAANATGRYGEAALHRFIRRTRALAPLQAVRSLLGDLRTFLGDATGRRRRAVCLDWTWPARWTPVPHRRAGAARDRLQEDLADLRRVGRDEDATASVAARDASSSLRSTSLPMPMITMRTGRFGSLSFFSWAPLVR